MRIQAINNFNSKMHFGNFSTEDDETPRNAKMQQPKNKSFYAMSNSDKLDKIYDMLKEQKQDLITLSKNQYKMHQCNDNASIMILSNLNFDDSIKIGKCYDNKRIDLIS